MPCMADLRRRIIAGELSNCEESIARTLTEFTSYREMMGGRHALYQNLCGLIEKPGCTPSDVWKMTYRMMMEAITAEKNMVRIGIFEACRDILTQWGGAQDAAVTMIRLAGVAEKCHASWRLYLQNASFLAVEEPEEEQEQVKVKPRLFMPWKTA